MDLNFYKDMKIYISSLTKRRCNYWFFNLYGSDVIIATNGNTIERKNNTLVEYCSPDLSFHCIRFKEPSKVIALKQELLIPNDKVIRIDIRALCAAMNKVKEDAVVTYRWVDGNLFLDINNEVLLIGDIYTNYIANTNIYNLTQEMEQMSEKYKDYEKVVKSLESIKFDNNFLHLNLEIGENKFKNVLMDGIDTVSMKEFVKKVAIPYRHELIYWIVDTRVEFITEFETDDVKIQSFRPNFRLFLLKENK